MKIQNDLTSKWDDNFFRRKTDRTDPAEPILSKRGFEFVTSTQPFCFSV